MGHKDILPDRLFFSRTSDFLDVYLVKQCGRSEKTRESYRDSLTVFKRYVLTTGKDILSFLYTDCTYNFLLGYKEYLSSELKYEPASINHRLATIKTYIKYSYGCDLSLLQTYISTASVPFSKVPKVQRDILDEKAISCLLDQPPASKKGLRDTIIMSLLFDAAIRLEELLSLTRGDIYHNDRFTYLLIHGKGNKERKVSLDQRTSSLLEAYLEQYHPDKNGLKKPLIYTTIKGITKPMSHRNVQKMIKKYAERLSGNDEKSISVYPHLLRRSRASGLYQNGTPIELVSRFLGHSSVETTKDYYAFPSLEQLRNAMEAGTQSDADKKPLWAGHEDELAKLCGLR